MDRATNFAEIVARVKGKPRKSIAVAMADEDDVLRALADAYKQGIADAILVGNKEKILACGREHRIKISPFDIVPAESEQQSVAIAINLVREHLADTLMKGRCSTNTLLKGVLDKEQGLRSGKLLSHLGVFEVPNYHKLLLMSDAALNIAPDLNAKVAILENAVQAAHFLGVHTPKVAVIAAVEKVNLESMPCTMDAAIIAQMAARGQIKRCLVDGPMALDNAVSGKSCEVKGLKSPVGGDADILLMPDIEAANVFYKTLAYISGAKAAGLILGAKVPVILTSRADNEEIKFLSIALGALMSVRQK
ncbi:MAG TPA: bifunctional enoyl-CoA hydratase/phosphate acetyltransferase [bacterium]|nr:bifunctional enoyl-CoA hydratase/phosphate acetyltransferase [bacterium]